MTPAEIITNKIIEALEKGIIVWRKPWRGLGAPKNLKSGKAYKGINVFLLAAQGFSNPYWLSFKQARAKGGSVRLGEKATQITFWKIGERTEADGTKKKSFLLLYYNVFNVEQCDGVDYPKVELVDHDPIQVCEAIVDDYSDKPVITHGGDRACYNMALDSIQMPPMGAFSETEDYYDTLFHELVHSTGNKARLGREMNGGMSSGSYAKEELVAEMGAAFLCGEAGIEMKTLDNSAAYIQGWLKQLRNDSKLVIQAASKAQKAVDYMTSSAVTADSGELAEVA